MKTPNRLEELAKLRQETERKIRENTRHLLLKGYAQEDLDLLDEALEYISYPILMDYFYENTCSM